MLQDITYIVFIVCVGLAVLLLLLFGMAYFLFEDIVLNDFVFKAWIILVFIGLMSGVVCILIYVINNFLK